jgi:hypothetical protein
MAILRASCGWFGVAGSVGGHRDHGANRCWADARRLTKDQAGRPTDDERPAGPQPGVAPALEAHCFRLLIDAAIDHAVCGLDAAGRAGGAAMPGLA